MEAGKHERTGRWKPWLIAAAISVVVVLLAVAGFAKYWIPSTADALRLTVVDSSVPPVVALDATVRGVAAEKVYAYLLAMPDASNFASCPINGPRYHCHLVFSHLGFTTVDSSLNTEECEFIYPVFGKAKYADGPFWAVLSQAVGQPLPFQNS